MVDEPLSEPDELDPLEPFSGAFDGLDSELEDELESELDDESDELDESDDFSPDDFSPDAAEERVAPFEPWLSVL